VLPEDSNVGLLSPESAGNAAAAALQHISNYIPTTIE
jgi:hypothetical protein